MIQAGDLARGLNASDSSENASSDDDTASPPIPIAGGPRRPAFENQENADLDCRFKKLAAGGVLGCQILVPLGSKMVPADGVADGLDLNWKVLLSATQEMPAGSTCSKGDTSYRCSFLQPPPTLQVKLAVHDTRPNAPEDATEIVADVYTDLGANERISVVGKNGSKVRARITFPFGTMDLGRLEPRVGFAVIASGEQPPPCTAELSNFTELEIFHGFGMVDVSILPSGESDIHFCISNNGETGFAQAYARGEFIAKNRKAKTTLLLRKIGLVDDLHGSGQYEHRLDVRLSPEILALPGKIVGYLIAADIDPERDPQVSCLGTSFASHSFAKNTSVQSWSLPTLTDSDYVMVMCYQPPGRKPPRPVNSFMTLEYDHHSWEYISYVN